MTSTQPSDQTPDTSAQPDASAQHADAATQHPSAADLSAEAAAPRVGVHEMTRAQALSATRERRLWDSRAESWDVAGSSGLSRVVEAVVQACAASDSPVALDLGCGSGQVTLPLAPDCSHVIAVDVSAPSLERLDAKARERGIENIQTVASPIEALELPAGSIDLVVTNYALHHLRDADKELVLSSCMAWLRPGGRLVIGDMMFGRGASAEDRAIIASKVRAFVSRGPAGWWRLAKNAVRFSLRMREKPMTAERWEAMVRAAGYADVSVTRILSEACVLTASKPLAG